MTSDPRLLELDESDFDPCFVKQPAPPTPGEDLRRARGRHRRRVRGIVVATLAGVLVAAGAGFALITTDRVAVPGGPQTSENGRGLGSNLIDGIRSDPDHQGLVVSYTGGACDKSARLVVKESPTRIDAYVVVKSKAGACTDVGIFRTVSARLDQPIGQRTIWSGGRQQIPFDGALLLVPATLPADYTEISEMGNSDRGASDPAAMQVTTTWVTTRSAARPTASSDTCAPGSASLQIRLGPVGENPARGRTAVGTAKVGTAQARLYRTGSSKKPIGWAYIWTVDRMSIEVGTTIYCNGGPLLSKSELLAVAKSLQPA